MFSFSEDPDVPLLRSLTRGALKQNLLRALRLWVWLRVLYADLDDPNGCLPDPFTFAEWRTTFFSKSHPTHEKSPPLHDATCPCARTTHDWLMLLAPELDLSDWKASLRQSDSLPDHFDADLKQRLFGVTRRSLDEDLRILAKLGWVSRQQQHYHRVTQLPRVSSTKAQQDFTQPLLHPDLAAIANTFANSINGHQRFFLHLEYIVPKEATDRVDDWQAQLQQIWAQMPIPPLQLTFYSTRFDELCTRIVYPVCVYYAQRGPYLCAWGQLPDNDTAMDWRHYRLDRIHDIQRLTWNAPIIPKALHQAYQRHKLPIPDEIQERMVEAWGFDFYQPAGTLLLRFEQEFAHRYIHNSLRHETFMPVSFVGAKALVRSHGIEPDCCRTLLRVLQARSPKDAYYTAQYRRSDPNILLRLRAWRPHLEVLLPWDLRQQIAAEVRQESRFYDEVESCSNSSKT
ncbi:MAG: TIGR03985 family CRISPR-associated protein [Stenomitos frigidus ULC029]